MNAGEYPPGWVRDGKENGSLFRRYDFPEYRALRNFLDELADLAEQSGVHPDNIGFGRDYVNITLELSGTQEHQRAVIEFAARLESMASAH